MTKKIKIRSRNFIFLISILLLISTINLGQENLDIAINNLASKISQHMAEKEKTKIAVIPFQDLKTDFVSTLGKYIAEELTTALFNSGKFYIIERNLLNKVLDELKLSQTGAVDPNSAKELGKITGVDAVVTGTIQDLITRVAVNCRLIETETGNIFAAASEKIIKDESISKLLNEPTETQGIEEKPEEEIAQDINEKYIEPKNKIFYAKSSRGLRIMEIKLFSVKIFPDRTVECTLIYKNILDTDMYCRGAIDRTYISDNFGNMYSCVSVKEAHLLRGSSIEAMIPPGIVGKITLIFYSLSEDANEINLISQQEISDQRARYVMRGNVIFYKIKIK